MNNYRVLLYFILFSVLIITISQAEVIPSKPAEDYKCIVGDVDEYGNRMVHVPAQKFITSKKDGENNFIVCMASCAWVADMYVITFFWEINSKNAHDTYGYISKDSRIILTSKNGETTELNYFQPHEGKIVDNLNQTLYVGQVVLDSKTTKSLESTVFEKAKMYWSKGKEEYQVSESTIFIGQLHSLDNTIEELNLSGSKPPEATVQIKTSNENRNENIKKIKQYFNGRNNSYAKLNQMIKNRLHNPKSFKHVKTEIIKYYENDGEYWAFVEVTYRGTNYYGGVITDVACAEVNSQGKIKY